MANWFQSLLRRVWLFPILPLVPVPASMAQWSVVNHTDVMTDKTTVLATLNAPVEHNGRMDNVQVNASCNSQSLTFQLIYSDQEFKQTANALTKPRVYLRVRLDQNEPFSVGSASDYPNEAFVRFVHESHDPLTVLGNLGAALSPLSVVSARLMRVELPLDNGDAPILEIRPQDVTLKKFLAACDFEDDPAPPSPNSPLHALTNRTYSGTADDFAGALPGYIQRAAVAMRLRPEDYAKETAAIVAAVRTCARVTPQMYTTLGGGPRPDFSKLGAEYTVCNLSTRVSDANTPIIRGKPTPAILMQMFDVGNHGSTGEDRGFSVLVSFHEQQGDSYRNIGFDNYGIVNATIYSAPPAVKQPVSETRLQKLTNRSYVGTLDSFAKELPAFVQRAAQAMSLNPGSYQKEIDFAIQYLHTCAQITPEIARQIASLHHGVMDLPDQYKFCSTRMSFRNISDQVKTYDKALERGIQLQVNPHGGDWREGQGIDVRVLFSPLPSERITSPLSYFDALGIVTATVH